MNTNQQLKQTYTFIEKKWNDEIIPQLKQYIEIPNKSPLFDKQWKAHGFMDQAMTLIANWCRQQPIKNMQLNIIEHEQRTPLLFIDIAGDSNDTILLYGHMDKQPEMEGWDKDLGPWKAVIKGDKLYGRGAADDGYSAFTALTAIAALQQQGIPHARCIVLIEGSEESGSIDLPFYLEQLKKQIGSPSLVICLDSSCANYDQLWSTTSLRGLVGGDLSISVLTEGIHSGLGSGAVPSTFTILRQLLARLEDTNTHQIVLESLHVTIPDERMTQAKAAAHTLGKQWLTDYYPLHQNTHVINEDVAEIILNRTWRPALSVTGMEGLPNLSNAGNVTVPKIAVKLSMRIPPTAKINPIATTLKKTLEQNPPFGATVNFTLEDSAVGWNAPPLAKWLAKANDNASQLFFKNPAGYLGEGGSIPFMGMLGEMYPQAQFLITGVLGPKSNAHGPNEFLHLTMAKKITACVSAVIASHFTRDY